MGQGYVERYESSSGESWRRGEEAGATLVEVRREIVESKFSSLLANFIPA